LEALSKPGRRVVDVHSIELQRRSSPAAD